MKISVALCTYNGEKYLPDQLASYLRQERLPDELVVCDDCSTDQTHEILDQFAKTAPFQVHIHVNEKNVRSTKNFERAFLLCQGDIVAPSDQDDVWNANKLRLLEEGFSKPEIGLVFTDANIVDANLNPLGYTLWQSIKFTPYEQEKVRNGDVMTVFMKHNVVTGTTMAFRAKFRNLFTPISPLWVHDGWIAFFVAMVADILPIPERTVQYRQHSQNQVGTPGTNLQAEIEYVLDQDENNQANIRDKYLALQECIQREFPQKVDVLQQIAGQVHHREFRSHLPQNRLYRLSLILGELYAGNYHNYSSGYRSAAKDILLNDKEHR